jgi:uncharacterized membrane protein YfcA
MLVESVRATFFPKPSGPPSPVTAKRRDWIDRLPWQRSFRRSGLEISILPLLGLGLFIGFAGAILGIGGGFIVVPALIYLFRIPASVVVGTSLFQILFTMMATTILHAVTNQSVDIVLALILIVGSVVGAQFGSRAGQKLRGEHFRLLLAILIFGVAVRFALEIGMRPDERFTFEQIEERA